MNLKKWIVLFTLVFSLSLIVACSNDANSNDANNNDNDNAEANDNNNNNNNNNNDNGDVDTSFYDGEQIETIIPYDAGGGSDVLGRYVAPFLADHVEGNPKVQVVNIPGSGSIIGMNEYFNMRDADGYNLIWSSGSTIMNHLLDTEGVDYDFSELAPVLGVPAGGVVYISGDIGYEEPKDILSLDEDLVYSGQSATGLDLVPLVSLDVLKLDAQALLGYEGSGPARVAFEQGESNLNYQTTAAYLTNVQPLVDSGEAIPLYSFGHFDSSGEIIRDPAFPDIPNVKEFYEDVYGEEPDSEEWDAYQVVASRGFTIQKILWTKKDAPQDAISLLQAGAESLANDDAFIDEGDDVLGGYEPVVGQDLVDLIDSTIQVELDPDMQQWILDYVSENFGE